MKKLNRAVIKEELVVLTGDYKKAIILNQMIYWSERVKDAAQLIEEEMNRTGEEMDYDFKYGWIYKKADELSEETMMGIQPKAMRSHLKFLVEKGWLSQRRNPHDKMDRTLQYRVNLLKIQTDLMELGYVLDNYPLPRKGEKENSKGQKENSERAETNLRKGKKENSSVNETPSATRDTECKNLPEITNRDYIQKYKKNGSWRDIKIKEKNSLPKAVRDAMDKPYNQPVSLSKERLEQQERINAKLKAMEEKRKMKAV